MSSIPATTEPPGPGPDLFEIVNGIRGALPPMSTFAGIVAMLLCRKLGSCADEKSLGWVVQEMLFGLSSNPVMRRRPDIVYVSCERWTKDRQFPYTDPWEVIPDLAVEIVSPTDRAEDVRLKVRDYFNAGCREVWLIHPQLLTLDRFTSPKDVEILKWEDTLGGREIFQGFHLVLAEQLCNAPDENQNGFYPIGFAALSE